MLSHGQGAVQPSELWPREGCATAERCPGTGQFDHRRSLSRGGLKHELVLMRLGPCGLKHELAMCNSRGVSWDWPFDESARAAGVPFYNKG